MAWVLKRWILKWIWTQSAETRIHSTGEEGKEREVGGRGDKEGVVGEMGPVHKGRDTQT